MNPSDRFNRGYNGGSGNLQDPAYQDGVRKRQMEDDARAAARRKPLNGMEPFQATFNAGRQQSYGGDGWHRGPAVLVSPQAVSWTFSAIVIGGLLWWYWPFVVVLASDTSLLFRRSLLMQPLWGIPVAVAFGLSFASGAGWTIAPTLVAYSISMAAAALNLGVGFACWTAAASVAAGSLAATASLCVHLNDQRGYLFVLLTAIFAAAAMFFLPEAHWFALVGVFGSWGLFGRQPRSAISSLTASISHGHGLSGSLRLPSRLPSATSACVQGHSFRPGNPGPQRSRHRSTAPHRRLQFRRTPRTARSGVTVAFPRHSWGFSPRRTAVVRHSPVHHSEHVTLMERPHL